MEPNPSSALFSDTLTDAMDDLVQRVHGRMVMIRNNGIGVGAGIIWRANGVILTNNHVLQHEQADVSLPDGRSLPGQVLDRDPEIDLALLQVDAVRLPTAMIADSRQLRVGELVFAIGHPWGEPGVVTSGVISGLGAAETRGPRRQVPIIRTDVTLAPGNSGGPLVNARGAVVGINAMIVGGNQGVAIPSHLAQDFAETALDRRVVLGVGVQPSPLPKGLAVAGVNGQEYGLLVVSLTKGGPAQQAGVIPGDILLQIDGDLLESPRTLLRALAARSPGDRVALNLLRAGELQQVSADLAPLEQAM